MMFQGDAIETPDGLEFFIGHSDFAGDGVADCYGFIADFKNSNAVVEQEGIPDDRKGNIGIF